MGLPYNRRWRSIHLIHVSAVSHTFVKFLALRNDVFPAYGIATWMEWVMFVMDGAVGLGKWWPAQILVLKILKCHMRVLLSATLIVELQRILPLFFFVWLDVLQMFSSSFIFTTFCDSQNTQVAWNLMTKNHVKLEKKTSRTQGVEKSTKSIETKFYFHFSLWRRQKPFNKF